MDTLDRIQVYLRKIDDFYWIYVPILRSFFHQTLIDYLKKYVTIPRLVSQFLRSTCIWMIWAHTSWWWKTEKSDILCWLIVFQWYIEGSTGCMTKFEIKVFHSPQLTAPSAKFTCLNELWKQRRSNSALTEIVRFWESFIFVPPCIVWSIRSKLNLVFPETNRLTTK